LINQYYSDKDYKKRCKRALRENDNVPFERDGDGLEAIETKCPECGANNPLKALRKLNFECAKCSKRLYDVENQ